MKILFFFITFFFFFSLNIYSQNKDEKKQDEARSYILGAVFAEKDDKIPLFKKSISIYPLPEAYFELGKLTINSDFNTAKEYFRESIKIYKTYIEEDKRKIKELVDKGMETHFVDTHIHFCSSSHLFIGEAYLFIRQPSEACWNLKEGLKYCNLVTDKEENLKIETEIKKLINDYCK